MKLQDQCCTREQGQRLVELGVKSEATFYHMPAKSGSHREYIQYGYHGDNLAPAFNVAELGEMLPSTLFESHKDEGPCWETTLIRGNGPGTYWHSAYDLGAIGPYSTEAQARAALLIHLLENKLITP